MDNSAAISHPGVKFAMTYPSKQGGARSAPCFQLYLMAIFAPGCEISAKLSMGDTSAHTSSPGTHGLDNNKRSHLPDASSAVCHEAKALTLHCP